MKKSIYYILCVILLAAVCALTSCSQDELTPEEEATPGGDIATESMEATSTTLQLMRRAVDNDGSYDNIVDGSSCFDIQFPYSVSVNGLALTIETMDDLETIEKIFDAFETDDDVLDIVFPITITLADYTEVTLSSPEDLRAIAEECVEGGEDDDIECIDFVYPITLYTFNPNLTLTGNVTATDDSELRRFFTGLREADLVSVEFPVSFELQDSTQVTVYNNAELKDAIESAIDICDEDDDNDYSDDDFTKVRLDTVLIACPWLVEGLERNNQDTTDQYEDYVLNFSENGSVVARDREGNLSNGQWNTRISDYRVVLNLEFELLVDFTQDWFVNDIDGKKIKLHAGDDNKIIMKRYCEDTPVACGEDYISETLDTCRWAPSQEEGDFLNDLRIDFSDRDIHVYDANGTVVDEGNWSIDGNIVVFSDLSMALANYIGQWEVLECSDVRFRLRRGDENLIIEKECDKVTVACSEMFISENISTCQWAPSQDENSSLDYLRIDFSNRNIHVRNPNGTVVDEGNWSITGNVLTFNNLSIALANYVGDWEVTECRGARFVLRRGEETLVIEKECE
ncbi:hypothetical protein FGM00_13250 [Aggregatimonas sangjinii]|uniref:Uncharacterized protein n=1 Tax=Aggregatimonas sangjinii TaxID=2583587 RepID=A0A5B7SW80_9FLAO|nr:hypothetical protein [Aggregatimonas sangjinii]QCX01030.1 hypothetical protein FGM00_13250 [Aggregatimonas sangjinii]